MISITVPRWTLVASVSLVALAVVMAARLDAQAAAKAPKPGTVQDSSVAARQQIDRLQQQINKRHRALLETMFDRIKSIKRRQGLTPDQAKAADDAIAAELAHINRAQDQLDAVRHRLAARKQPTPKKAAPPVAPPPSNLVARVEALERRVTALEMASTK